MIELWYTCLQNIGAIVLVVDCFTYRVISLYSRVIILWSYHAHIGIVKLAERLLSFYMVYLGKVVPGIVVTGAVIPGVVVQGLVV